MVYVLRIGITLRTLFRIKSDGVTFYWSTFVNVAIAQSPLYGRNGGAYLDVMCSGLQYFHQLTSKNNIPTGFFVVVVQIWLGLERFLIQYESTSKAATHVGAFCCWWFGRFCRCVRNMSTRGYSDETTIIRLSSSAKY